MRNNNGASSPVEDLNRRYTNWRKASASTNQGGSCIEVARANEMIGVRDSKLSGRGPVLQITVSAWAHFAADVRRGRYDVA